MTSTERPRLLLALTPIAERSIEPLLFGEGAPVELVGSASEADELDRLTEDREAVAALVSPQLAGITAGHCARVRAAGVRVVGLALDDDDREQLDRIGADTIIGVDSTAEQLDAAVADAGIPGATSDGARGSSHARRDDAARAVLAVVGSKGAPGVTEFAASLAALANERWPVLLIELDAMGGDLDVRVAADPDEGSVLGLVRAVQTDREHELHDLLSRWTVGARGWPAVLLGPTAGNGATAELARPGAVARGLDAVAELWPAVVCDVGFALTEQNDAAARIHREALVHADAVLLVLGARETQLRHGLAQLDALLDDLAIGRERIRVVVNGLGGPGTPDRRTIQDAVNAALAERRLAADAWLTWDARALRRAQRLGLPLARAHPRGPYARALGRLLDTLFLPTAEPAARSRKDLLAAPASRSVETHAKEPV